MYFFYLEVKEEKNGKFPLSRSLLRYPQQQDLGQAKIGGRDSVLPPA